MIGATGMLSGTAAWVAERSERTVLVSRNAPQSPLANRSNVVALSADWRNLDEFLQVLARADGFGDVQLAVLWMHSDGAQAKQHVLKELSNFDCLIVDVQGSSTLTEVDRPAGACDPAKRARLITVKLGAVKTAADRRWLTWDEISNGTIAAIEAGESRVVGGPS